MNKKVLGFLLLLILPLLYGKEYLYSQQNDEYSVTAAKIERIESKGTIGKKRIFATVSFKTEKGREITTIVELLNSR